MSYAPFELPHNMLASFLSFGGSGNSNIRARLPDLSRTLTVPTKTKNILTRNYMFWHTKLVICSDFCQPLTRAKTLAKLLWRVQTLWVITRRVKPTLAARPSSIFLNDITRYWIALPGRTFWKSSDRDKR